MSEQLKGRLTDITNIIASKKGYSYKILSTDLKGFLVEIYKGNNIGYISLDDNGTELELSFHSQTDSWGGQFFEEHDIIFFDEDFDFNLVIEDMMNNIQEINKSLNKIKNYISKINDICDFELGIDSNNIINSTFDIEDYLDNEKKGY